MTFTNGSRTNKYSYSGDEATLGYYVQRNGSSRS